MIKALGNPILTGFTAPKILWLKENEPEVFQKVCTFMLPKDYIIFKLTKKKTRNNFNPQKLEDNIWNVYSYRGLTKDGTPTGEPATVYKDDNAVKLVSNYAAGFSRLASYYRRKAYTAKDSTEAFE